MPAPDQYDNFKFIKKSGYSPAFKGLYVHLPFCRSICPFCSFPVLRGDALQMDYYLKLLYQEIDLWKQKFEFAFSDCYSLYFGGGTPSCYPASSLIKLKDKLCKSFRLSNLNTVSIELNPEDCELDYVEDLTAAGFDRFSLGIQSFLSHSLARLNRINTQEQNFQAIEILKQAGVKNLNLDLLYGYPDLSLIELERDLEYFLKANVQHISAYGLTIEPNTPVFKNRYWTKWQIDHEGLFAEQFEYINYKLRKNGFTRYEISNFCQPKFESSQNIIYWNQQSFLGVGLGAFSRGQTFRFSNFPKFKSWERMILEKKLPLAEVEMLDHPKILNEYLVINLRRNTGLKFNDLVSLIRPLDWSKFFLENLAYLQKEKLIQITKDNLVLTEKGLMLADSLCIKISELLNR